MASSVVLALQSIIARSTQNDFPRFHPIDGGNVAGFEGAIAGDVGEGSPVDVF
jgi:hypothetical protein